jgi:LEA14-like dessication related protein
MLRFRLFLAALLATVSSCRAVGLATAGVFEKPRLSFVRAELREVDRHRLELDTVWRVENPNAADLRVSALKYEVQLEGQPCALGSPPLALLIPGREATELRLPATVSVRSALVALARAAGSSEGPHYRAIGEVVLDTPVGPVSLPFVKEGTVASWLERHAPAPSPGA